MIDEGMWNRLLEQREELLVEDLPETWKEMVE